MERAIEAPVRLSVALVSSAVVTVACVGSTAVSPPVADSQSLDPEWSDLWTTRGVDPAPPRDFMEGSAEPPTVFNATNGALDDEIARRWVMADPRRRSGLFWAGLHLRRDILEAGVFGPPGLNGLGRAFDEELAKGNVSIDCRARAEVVSSGVVAVSESDRAGIGDRELTDLVIVKLFRMTGKGCTSLDSTGHKAHLCGPPDCPPPGDLTWHVSAGVFRDEPVMGPVWYEAHEWSCQANDMTGPNAVCEFARSVLTGTP